jgi:outer membrane protein assembly factor BamB
MKLRITPLLLILMIGGVFLSACTGAISASSWPGITVNQDTVYLADAGSVFSIRLSDGNMLWRYPEKASASRVFYAVPVIADGSLIVGDYSNKLQTLDAQSGSEKWSFADAKGRWISAVLVDGDTILAPNADHSLYALDKQGKLLWQFKSKHSFWSQPVVKDDVVYISSMDHSLYALQLSGGKKLWSIDLGGALVSSPALDDKTGTLFVGSLAKEVVAVSKDGKILWRFSTKDNIWSQPVISEGALYFGDLSGTVYSLNINDGSQRWTANAGGPVIGSVAITTAGLLVGTETGNVVMLDANGAQVWNRTIKGKLYATPAVSSDRIVFGVNEGDALLVAMDLKGNTSWSFSPPK